MYIDVTGFSNEGRCCSKKKKKTKNKAPGAKNAGSGRGPGSIFLFLKECCFRGRLGLGFVSTITQTLTLKQHSFF